MVTAAWMGQAHPLLYTNGSAGKACIVVDGLAPSMPTIHVNNETNPKNDQPERTERETTITTIAFQRNASIVPQSISDLREAVGWDPANEDYPAAFQGYWGTVSGFDDTGTLVAWCAILSDGVRHAVLIDVIVHPTWQRQGIGQALVKESIAFIREHGISIIHVDFIAEHQTFYEHCGFQTGLGGIIEG